jgi:hypothetical protein
VSKLSYSVYLGHPLVFTVLSHRMAGRGAYEALVKAPEFLYAIFLLGVFAFAAATYACVEKPFLALRDAARHASLDPLLLPLLPAAALLVFVAHTGTAIPTPPAVTPPARASMPGGDGRVYINTAGELVYRASACDSPTLDARFFVHVYPINPLQTHGVQLDGDFVNMDFSARDLRPDPTDGGVGCDLKVPLPPIEISKIHVGQFETPGGACCKNLWEVVIDLQAS